MGYVFMIRPIAVLDHAPKWFLQPLQIFGLRQAGWTSPFDIRWRYFPEQPIWGSMIRNTDIEDLSTMDVSLLGPTFLLGYHDFVTSPKVNKAGSDSEAL